MQRTDKRTTARARRCSNPRHWGSRTRTSTTSTRNQRAANYTNPHRTRARSVARDPACARYCPIALELRIDVAPAPSFCARHVRPGLDQRARVDQVLGAARPRARPDRAVPQVPGAELAGVGGRRARRPRPSRTAGPTYSSDAQSARSLKKYGTSRYGSVGAEHRPRRVAALLQRHVPVLDPQPPAVDDAVVRAARRRRRRSPAPSVSSFASQTIPSSTSSPARSASIASGRTPAPTTTMSALDRRARSSVTTACTRPVALERLQLLAAEHLDPVRRRAGRANQRPDLLAERARERHVLQHHDRAPRAHRGQRRRHLAADVAAADQHHPLGRLRLLADRVGVAERAQVVDPLELGALDAQDVDVRAGGQQRLAEPHLLPALELRRPRARDRATSRSSASRSSTPFSSYHSAGLT